MFLNKIIRAGWSILPEGVRAPIRGFPPAAAWRSAASRRRWGHLTHEEIYDRAYFDFVEKTTGAAAGVMADSICAACQPAGVLDVGCGTGALLARLAARGVRGVGLERSSAGLAACLHRGLDVRPFDIVADQAPAIEVIDLVVSMEVGQQLAASHADRYVDLLCHYRSAIVFSSDKPGGGDRNPLNEKPHGWWVEKFQRRGYSLDDEVTTNWRRAWKSQGISRWFYENVMLLRRKL